MCEVQKKVSKIVDNIIIIKSICKDFESLSDGDLWELAGLIAAEILLRKRKSEFEEVCKRG